MAYQLNLNQVAQVVLDVGMDKAVLQPLLSKLVGNVRIDTATSIVYHVLDEIGFPLLEDTVAKVPSVGPTLNAYIRKARKKGLPRIATYVGLIALVQYLLHGEFDFLEALALTASTVAIDESDRVPGVGDMMDKAENIGVDFF